MKNAAVVLSVFFLSAATVMAQTAPDEPADAGTTPPPAITPAASTAAARPDLSVPLDTAKK